MEMEREKLNPSAADIPRLAKAMRGIDVEREKAKALSFNEMRRRVEAWWSRRTEARGSTENP